MSTSDVLGETSCASNADHCYSTLPKYLMKSSTELLAVDDSGSVFKWDFGSSSGTAARAWQAFHDGQTTGTGANTGNWNPAVLEGSWTGADQDAFQYREQNGIKSVMLDDDNCDCHTTLSMGHGMCGGGYSSGYGNGYTPIGVDELSDDECESDSAPKASRKLVLFYRSV